MSNEQRAAFEAWDMFKLHCSVRPERAEWLPDADQYNFYTTQMMWEAWQAASAGAEQAPPERSYAETSRARVLLRHLNQEEFRNNLAHFLGQNLPTDSEGWSQGSESVEIVSRALHALAAAPQSPAAQGMPHSVAEGRCDPRSNRLPRGAEMKRRSTLAEQVADARREVASWTPEHRASVQLEGTDPYAPKAMTHSDQNGELCRRFPDA